MKLHNIYYEVHEVHCVPNPCVLLYFTFQSIHFSQSFIFLLWQLSKKKRATAGDPRALLMLTLTSARSVSVFNAVMNLNTSLINSAYYLICILCNPGFDIRIKEINVHFSVQ